MAKKIKMVTLFNSALDERDEYRMVNVTTEVLNKSKEEGGSEAMKELVRNRLDELFNGDIEEYFGEDHVTGEPNVTQEDVEDCINRLAKGDSAYIFGEDFWWSDEEDLITEL